MLTRARTPDPPFRPRRPRFAAAIAASLVLAGHKTELFFHGTALILAIRRGRKEWRILHGSWLHGYVGTTRATDGRP